MFASIQSFIAKEDGAITVDWVVLTAACATLGILATLLMTGAVEVQATEVSDAMAAHEISADFDVMTAPAAELVAPETTEVN